MHAVPIQMSAMIHIPARTGGATKRAATTAAFGIHHADALVRGLLSQSRELWPASFAMMVIRYSTKQDPSHANARLGSVDTEPSRRNKTSGASSVRDLDGIADRFAKVNHGRAGN